MYIYVHLCTSATFYLTFWTPSFLCAKMYTWITFWNTWITFLHIFKHFFFGTTKKHFFPASKKMWLNVFARKKHFGTFYHTWFSWHILKHFVGFHLPRFGVCCFFAKNVLLCAFFKKCYPSVFQVYIFPHFPTFFTSTTIILQQKQQKNSNINKKNVHKRT